MLKDENTEGEKQIKEVKDIQDKWINISWS
jgi:hypothetical protein